MSSNISAITGGRIYTMKYPGDFLSEVYIKNGRISKTPGDGDTVDITGKIALPAFEDTHIHFFGTGLSLAQLDISELTSLSDVKDAIAGRVKNRPNGRITAAFGYAPENIEGEKLSGEVLDSISRDIPIFVRRKDGHSSFGNNAFIRLLLEETDIEPDDVVGGFISEKAHTIADRFFSSRITREELIEAAAEVEKIALSNGCLTLHSYVPKKWWLKLLLEIAPALKIRIVAYPEIEDIEFATSLGLGRIGGCILLDGSFGSHSAALFEPYADDPDNLGILYKTDEEVASFFTEAQERGLQVALHAIGDRAIEQFIKGAEESCLRLGEPFPHIIEHCELVHPEQIDRMAKIGLRAGIQPTFDYLWGKPGGMYEKRLGNKRKKLLNPFRDMLDSGILLAGGSDSPITPINPLLGIYSAVHHNNRSQRISVFEAISLFTSNAAKLIFQDNIRGTVEVGKYADFVILDSDILDGEDTLSANPVMLIREGKIIFSNTQS